ncbi:MAG: dihydrodipicolinate reductase [Dehalococcoidia bacterium]
MATLRIVLVGLGEIGQAIGRAVLGLGATIVGAVDPAPDKMGRDLGELLGQPAGAVKVQPAIENVAANARGALAILATRSNLKDTFGQIKALSELGMSVLSTCEELSFPYASEPELAAEVDRLARQHGVAVLGTGINPGFLMDTLPLTLSAMCQEVRQISVRRVIDAARRRGSFQRKVGVGLSLPEFEKQIQGAQISGHVGLEQSIRLVASALGWHLDSVVAEAPTPVVSGDSIGGLRQQATGIRGGRPVIQLVFEAYAGAEDLDSIEIDGVPPIHTTIRPGVHGDLGTVAVVVNCIPRLLQSPPGLHTMADFALACYSPRLSDPRSPTS